jgi:hypothetical protein
MKRRRGAFLLTAGCLSSSIFAVSAASARAGLSRAAAGLAPARPGARVQVVALKARELVVLRDGVAARPCADARNALRFGVSLEGAIPIRPVPVRLLLALPGGAGEGTVLAEGSMTFSPVARTVTFTFLHVDIPARIRGRGARLVAQVNADRTVPEPDVSDNHLSIALDAMTDWKCASTF